MGVVRLQPYRGQQSDTVKALEELLEEARRPEAPIVGFAYVVIRQPREHSVGLAGLPRYNGPNAVLTRGLLSLLDDQLAALVKALSE
jgi:hypothetical protein